MNGDDPYRHPVEGGATVRHSLALYQPNEPNISEGHYLGVDSSYANRVNVTNAPIFHPIYQGYVKAIIEYTAPMEIGEFDVPLHIYNSAGQQVSTGNLSKTLKSLIKVESLPPVTTPQPPTTPPNVCTPTIEWVADVNHPTSITPGDNVIVEWEVKNDSTCDAMGYATRYHSFAPVLPDTIYDAPFDLPAGATTIISGMFTAPQATDFRVYFDLIDDTGTALPPIGERLYADFGQGSDNVPPPPPPPAPVDPCEDIPPPEIPYIDMWQSGLKGLAVPIANATSSVGGLFAEHKFNSDSKTDMDDLGSGLFGRSETTGKNGTNGFTVTATDECGSTTRNIDVPATDSSQNGESCLKSDNSCGSYTASQGDPINSSNGNFVHSYTDAAIASIGDYPIHLRRGYNSDAGRWATASIVRYHDDGSEEIIAGPPRYFGKGWSSNLGAYVLTVDKAPYYEGAQVLYPDGQTVLFKKQGNSYENDAPANFDQLSRDGDGYLLERKASLQKWYFNSDGNLSKIIDRNGNTTTFSYQGKLLKRIANAKVVVWTLAIMPMDKSPKCNYQKASLSAMSTAMAC